MQKLASFSMIDSSSITLSAGLSLGDVSVFTVMYNSPFKMSILSL